MDIKANKITLNDLFGLNKEKENFLQSNRMFISSADAWGTLIKDLVLALGIERAKRFLLRYGYQCGRHEAMVLKNLFSWENKREWIMGGVTMHNLTGRTTSVPIKTVINPESGKFEVEGHWHNSYEARQYLQHFPPHSEAVCYFLEGYASGYCSTSFGKKIVFKEVECIGKGDRHCYFIGKTLEAWGNEISKELVDYGREDIGNELDQAYKRIERQSVILKRGNILGNQLTQIVLQGKGLDSIAQTLGRSLKCGIVISNKQFETITEYGQVFDYSLKNIIENKSALTTSDQKKIDELLEKRITIQLNTLDQQGFTHYPLITPIIVQNNVNGYISIIKESEEMEELESSFAERAANICALHILNEKTAIETEQRMKGELLDELLLQPKLDANITNKLSLLGYDLSKPQFVILFQLQNQFNDEILGEAKSVIINLLLKYSEPAKEQILISDSFGKIKVLIPEKILNNYSNENAYHFGDSILCEVKKLFPSLSILISISDISVGMDKIHERYNEANKALEIAQINGHKQKVILFSDIRHISILLDARNPKELEGFADNILGPVYQSDEKKETEYLKTIYFYLKNEGNLHKTARILNLSIGGMRYRLQSLKDKFNLDIMNYNTRREVQMALDIYLAFGKFYSLHLNISPMEE